MTSSTSPPPRRLGHQVWTVVQDLPRFLGAPLVRAWHLRWGATDDEVAAPMPGDDLVPGAAFVPTRAVTIEAPPEDVWPWLVQVGAGHAGWYSDDLLDNLARPSAEQVLEEEQRLVVGRWVPMSPFGPPTADTAFRVHSFDEPRWLLWTKTDSTWAWRLTPVATAAGTGTRLVTRVHARYDWSRPALALLGLVLMELGDFAMQRRMLLGIRERAERLAARHLVAAPR